MPELNPPRNAACRELLMGILVFKGFTARRLYKLFGVKVLIVYLSITVFTLFAGHEGTHGE
jgi:hypothetical protein